MDQEIQNLMQTYQRGLNEADVDLVRAVYADDAVFIGQPFPTATGIEEIVALYADFFSKLDFDVHFHVQEIELSGDLGFVRTRSHGTIVPKGQNPEGREGNREIFVVKNIDGEWKFYRYIFNAEV
jgi:uncharacterized protein (TIGR02246 family)